MFNVNESYRDTAAQEASTFSSLIQVLLINNAPAMCKNMSLHETDMRRVPFRARNRLCHINPEKGDEPLCRSGQILKR